MPALKSTWWRPRSLAEIGRLSDSAIRRQETDYFAWLRQDRQLSADGAEAVVTAQRDIVANAPAPVAPSGASRVNEERPISARVTIRTVRAYTTGEHWEPNATGNGWYWNRFPCNKPAAPTLYWIMVDGRRRDSFLTLGRAKELADRLAKETRAEAIATPPSVPALPAPVVNLPAQARMIPPGGAEIVPFNSAPRAKELTGPAAAAFLAKVNNLPATRELQAMSGETLRAALAASVKAVGATAPSVSAPDALPTMVENAAHVNHKRDRAREHGVAVAAYFRAKACAAPPAAPDAPPCAQPVPALPAPVPAAKTRQTRAKAPRKASPALPVKAFWIFSPRHGIGRVEIGR